MPGAIKVLGTSWKVKQHTGLKVNVENVASTVYAAEGVYHEHEAINVLGVTDGTMSVIALETEQGEDKFRVTLMHELLHAIISEAGLQDVLDGNQEERVVKRMAPILRQVLKDNPRVYTFLTGRRLW